MAAAQTFLQNTTNNTGQSTYTFSAQNIGTAASDRYVIVISGVRAVGTTGLTSSCTIQGISATSVVSQLTQITNTSRIDMFVAAVPTGTTADIVLTYSRAGTRCLIDAYRATGISGAAPSATATSSSDPASGTITIPADGFAIAGGLCGGVGSSFAAWTNLTERSDVWLNSNTLLSSASDDFATLQTARVIDCEFQGTASEPASVFAAWSPFAGSVSSILSSWIE